MLVITYLLYVMAILAIFIIYQRRLPTIIASYLLKHHPLYRTYSTEDKRKIIYAIKASIYINGYAGDERKTVEILHSLTQEQQNIVTEARKNLFKHYYVLGLIVLGILLVLWPFMF